ncbi:MAG: Mur ligase family protein [Planctomycetota bacterium]
MIRNLHGRRVTVMGLGRFGGGAGVTRWLARQGATVLVTDLLPPDQLGESSRQITDLVETGRVERCLGEHREADFTDCDLVVANPAVPRPWENEYLALARSRGIPVTTEIRLLVERLSRARVIGVTGTAGKSTTAAMIHHVLRGTGRLAHLGGNIGGSLLGDLDRIRPDDLVVLELSSAMLYWLGAGVGWDDAPGFSPHVAVLTNVQPNHLDWHGTMEHYEQSKQNIFRYQQPGDLAITSADASWRKPVPLRLPGQHNQENARLAIEAVVAAAGLEPDVAARTLGDFAGLPHRLRLVASAGGQRFFDDSKATTPEATVLAVTSFDDPGRVHLVAGGYDKEIDLGAIAELRPRLAGLYTIGATGPDLAAAALRREQHRPGAGEAGGPDAHVEHCERLETAVHRAISRMGPRDILLLSPGCASWDQFDNFEQRGDEFAGHVREELAGMEKGLRKGGTEARRR